MDKPFYELDPDGDIILILRNPNAPFAAWDERAEDFSEPLPNHSKIGPRAISEPSSRGASPEPEDDPLAPVDDDLEAEPAGVRSEFVAHASFEPNVANSETFDADHTKRSEIQFRLSSRHLISASSFFKKALGGPWREGNSVTSDGCRYIHTEEWDPDALLVLMQIIHGRNWSVPRSVSLEMLAKIAVLVDYYKCHEAVAMFSEIWIKALEGQVPAECSRELILWLVISRVFSRADIFTAMTRTAMRQSRRPLPTLELPALESVVGGRSRNRSYIRGLIRSTEVIDKAREESVNRIIIALHDLLERFRNRQAGCSFECSSILLGALTIQMHTAAILELRPKPPYLGYSFTVVIEMVRSFQSPRWVTRDHYGGYVRHSCSITSLIQPMIEDAEKSMGGLMLGDFPNT
ncbi:hypothetical protein DL768_004214 [Monosporascus sp. mg162]|nr:hypothetical protein DL768_004214 [Monosporascus sp. mg162]